GKFAAEVYLDQDRNTRIGTQPKERGGERLAVEGLNEIEGCDRGCGLVALELADQMPADLRERLERGPFRDRFLDVVFAKHPCAGMVSGGNGFRRLGLAGEDEANRISAAMNAAGGLDDPSANLGESLRYLPRFDHPLRA